MRCQIKSRTIFYVLWVSKFFFQDLVKILLSKLCGGLCKIPKRSSHKDLKHTLCSRCLCESSGGMRRQCGRTCRQFPRVLDAASHMIMSWRPLLGFSRGQSVITSSIADPCLTTSAPTAVLTCLWGQVQYERRRRQLLKLVTLMACLAWAPGISALLGVSAPLLFLELAGHKQRLTAKRLALLTCQIQTAKVLRNISDKALVALHLQFHGVLDGNAERWNRWKRVVASHVLAALTRSKARQFAWVKLNEGGCCCPSYRPRGMTQKLCHSLGLQFTLSGRKKQSLYIEVGWWCRKQKTKGHTCKYTLNMYDAQLCHHQCF